MKAITFEAVGTVAFSDRPEPRIEHPGDAIVRVTAAGVCGSDLHIVEGRDTGVRLGTTMGHELVGIVEEVGRDVAGLAAGDRVVSPFSVSCGRCFFCLRDITARCVSAMCLGVVNEDGTGLQGAQAELVRIPMASATLVPLPARKDDGSPLPDEEALLLGDILATGWLTAERSGVQPGDVVAVIGCGPVGLCCAVAALALGARAVVAVDGIAFRREKARELGAQPSEPAAARSRVDALTDGRGADAVLEAVGTPAALDLAVDLARAGATISVAGYHTEPSYPLAMGAAYTKNLTLRFGRCSARPQIAKLLPLVLGGTLAPGAIVSHVLPLSGGVRGYEMFRNREEGVIKVVLKP